MQGRRGRSDDLPRRPEMDPPDDRAAKTDSPPWVGARVSGANAAGVQFVLMVGPCRLKRW